MSTIWSLFSVSDHCEKVHYSCRCKHFNPDSLYDFAEYNELSSGLDNRSGDLRKTAEITFTDVNDLISTQCVGWLRKDPFQQQWGYKLKLPCQKVDCSYPFRGDHFDLKSIQGEDDELSFRLDNSARKLLLPARLIYGNDVIRPKFLNDGWRLRKFQHQ